MWKEFKEFISRGNVMDLAVGVIIGGAFQAIITSLVNDIIMPVIGMITGQINFADLEVTVGSAKLTYGNFITAVINFLIIALVIFFMVKSVNSFNKKSQEKLAKLATKKGKKEAEAEGEPTTKLCPHCLSEIPFKATKCSHCTSDLKE